MHACMKIKVYTRGVNEKDFRVSINITAPTIAGKTSRTHVNDSLGCMPDQIRTTRKSASRMEGYFIGSGQLSVNSCQILDNKISDILHLK